MAVSKEQPSPAMQKSGFRVIIVGGGIGGLALAITLQHAGIDYLLIEKADQLAPQVGASIGILPNGARILDQLGCFDKLAEMTVDMESTASHSPDGSLIGEVSNTLSLMKRRTNYPVIFIDRQLLLQELARRIVDPDRILLQKVVRSLEQDADKAVVNCSDGTKLEADVVVGSDGVHSIVREEMWRHADADGDGERFVNDKKAMSAEYKCLFGISTSISGMEPGQTDRTYAHGLSTLSYVGKGGRVFWFIFIKMDRVYYPPHIPKFTSDDVTAMIQQHGHIALRAENVTISDLYDKRVCCNLVAIEEAKYQHWAHGRLVCMGDSIHKMTPNLGAGASSALESAAVLSNVLVPLASSAHKPSLSTIRSVFGDYQKDRELRVGRAMQITNKLTRVQALQTKKDYIFAHYIAPRMDDQYAEAFSSFVIGAPVVNHLPIPERSLRGTMPFNPKQGWGYEELMRGRVLRGLPLIALALLSLQRLSPYLGWLYQASSTSQHGPGNFDGSLISQAATQHSLAFSINSDATYGLWLLESARLSNKTSLIRFPILFGLGWQYWEVKAAIPLYFFLLHVSSPIERFRASDNRLTDLSYSCSVGLLVFVVGMFPKILNYVMSSVANGEAAGSNLLPAWIVQPPLVQLLLLSASQQIIARFIRPSTIHSDRIWAVDRDVVLIRCTTGFFAALTSFTWVNYLIGLRQLLHDGGITVPPAHAMLPSILEWSGTTLTLTATIWLILVFQDLRNAGMLDVSWLRMFLIGSATLACFGPATMLIAGWQWREEVLHSRRHRDAVVTRQQDYSK